MSADDHGNKSTYVNHACRCDECKAAWATYCRKLTVRRAAALAAGTITAPHGHASTYLNYKCRCEACRTARTEYLRKRDFAAIYARRKARA